MLLFILCKKKHCPVPETTQVPELKQNQKDAEQKPSKEMLIAIPPTYKDTNCTIQF